MRIAIYTKQATNETILQVINIVSLLEKLNVEVLLCEDIFIKTENKISQKTEKFSSAET